jgi:peptidoglycan/LPS O-acetylase OafA/YrhL
MPRDPSSRLHRIDYIDGLRAVAVLAVILHHVGRQTGVAGATARIVHEGAHGVDLFFVLSGFCLAFPTLAKIARNGASAFDVADFGAKRLVRILPPFYIATLALIAVFALPHLLRHEAPTVPIPSFGNVVASMLFLDERVHLINGAFWTLMVEFRWYFAFPLLLALWVRAPRAFFAVGLASFVLYHFTRARGVDLGTLPGFMLGIVAADLQLGGAATRGWGAHVKRWAIPAAIASAALGVAVEGQARIPGLDGNDVLFPYQPTILGWQLATFFLVVAAGSMGPLRSLLALKPLVATGIASYGLYLVHEPAIEFVTHRLNHGLVAFGLATGAALAAGFGFWFVAERPFTTGPLRRPLVDWFAPLIARVLAWLGLGRRIEIASPVVDDGVRAPAAVASVAVPVPSAVPAGAVPVGSAVVANPVSATVSSVRAAFDG